MNHGLPHAQHSIENAVFINHTNMWPYIIDPQEQAVHWIEQTEQKAGLKTVSANDVNCLRIVENAIRLGEPVMMVVGALVVMVHICRNV